MSFITDLLTGGASKATKKYSNAQAGIANQQAQMTRDVLPQYMKGLDFLSQYAGLGNYHPADYGSYNGQQPSGMPPNPQDRLATLGSNYNPPPQQQGWNWNAPGSAAPSAPASPKTGHDYATFGAVHGQGDPMGPSPYQQMPAFDRLPQGAGTMQMHQPGFDTIPPGPGTRGKGDPNLVGGEGDPLPSLPAVGPNPYPKPPTPPQMSGPATTAPPPGATQPMNRQQQFIANSPGLGPVDLHNNFHQNFQQEQQGYNKMGGGNMAQGAATNAMGPSPYTNNANATTGGVSNNQMGIFNDPADQLRNAQAQDDINHQNYLNQQNLRAQLGSRGLEDSSILGGGLAQMNENALQNYAGYRRNLAMNAGPEQQNRVMQMMQALSGGMGGAQQASQNYNNLGQMSWQQQQAAQQALMGLGSSVGMMYGMGGFGDGGISPTNGNWGI